MQKEDVISGKELERYTLEMSEEATLKETRSFIRRIYLPNVLKAKAPSRIALSNRTFYDNENVLFWIVQNGGHQPRVAT